MDAAVSALLLCALGVVLMRRDLRGLVRRRTWHSAEAQVSFLPDAAGPSWRIDFTLPDGAPVSVRTRDLRLVARRAEDGRTRLLYDPAAPSRVDWPGRPGIALVVGLALTGLGVAQLLL